MLVAYCLYVKQKTAYELRISYWSSDVCSSDLDAGLLEGNLLERVAEVLQMIHRYRRNRGGERPVDHVGGVEPTAEPDLQHQRVGRHPRARQQCRGGGDLEQGDRHVAVARLALLQHRREGRVAALLPGQHDALVAADEMRRGGDVHPVADGEGGV